MFCAQCSKSVPEESAFCPACGNRAAAASTPALAAATSNVPVSASPKSFRWLWPAVMAVAVVVAVGVGVTALMGGTFTNSIGMKMVHLPARSFVMGSTEKEYEKPIHTVQIAKAFHIASTEVTQGQWEAIMSTRPWDGKEYVQSGANYPAVFVSWDEAHEFCRRLSAKEGKPYRLPSESEWEYAARAGGDGKWCFGSNEGSLGTYAWFDKNTWDIGEKYAHLVGTKQANAFGLFDMHGNVWEWCEDTWHDSYAGAPSDGSAWVIDGNQAERVHRDGSFDRSTTITRSASRGSHAPRYRNYLLGFRVVVAART